MREKSLCLLDVQDGLALFLKHVAYSLLPAVQGSRQGRLQEALSRLRALALAGFMRAYPFIHMAQEGLTFSYQLAYLLQSSPYFSPTLHVLGQHVVRTSAQELVCPKKLSPCVRLIWQHLTSLSVLCGPLSHLHRCTP